MSSPYKSFESEPPTTSDEEKIIRLTEFGRRVLEANDQAVLERIEARSGKYPHSIAEHFAARIGPDNSVVMSSQEVQNTFGEFLRPDMPVVIQGEVPLPKPKIVTGTDINIPLPPG